MRRPTPPDLRPGEKVHAYGHVGSDGSIVPNLNRKARRKRDRLEMRASTKLKKIDPAFGRETQLGIAMGEMAKAIAGMAMRQALGPAVLEELKAAVAADPSQGQPDLKLFTAALERMADAELRQKCRLILGAFYGPPPAWMVDFANGGSLEVARAAMEESRLFGKSEIVVEHDPSWKAPEGAVAVSILGDIARARDQVFNDGGLKPGAWVGSEAEAKAAGIVVDAAAPEDT